MPLRACAVALLLTLCPSLWAAAPPAAVWWPRPVEAGLSRAGANRGELLEALRRVPARQRDGMAFLIANMPERDLRSLSAAFLLGEVDLAYHARPEAPWGGQVPDDVFLKDVLPSANLDEPRRPWRRQLREVCLPI